MKVYLNDGLVDISEAKVSVMDHGLLYGDGIFEGIRLYDGCIFKLEEHLERFEYSAKSIMLNLPRSRREISDAIRETCRANNLKNGYIRLLVTRGEGSLGLSVRNCKSPQLIIIANTIQLYPEELYVQGLKIITVPTQRCSPASLPPTVKSLNYLNNILAKMEAEYSGYHEALMLNDKGYVAECSGDNVFIVQNSELITPATSSGALKGITRGVVFEIAEELGIPWREGNITRYDVWVADELFLTGTAAEIVPIIEVDARIIGTGKPGVMTTRFMENFRRRVSTEGTLL